MGKNVLLFEIAVFLNIRNKVSLKFPFIRPLTEREILSSYDYKAFKRNYPVICRVVEENKYEG